MTLRYVGPGGSDANSGLTWALRKLTLNGVEDTPVVAGDTIYVGPGTYRETLTVDVSGTAGNPITYIGDYSGANTDGIGGVVRITGSDNDQSATRTNCITATAKAYRTFNGFLLDTTVGRIVTLPTSSDHFIFQNCNFIGVSASGSYAIDCGAAPTNNTIDGCYFDAAAVDTAISFTSAATTSDTGNVVQNSTFVGGLVAVNVVRVGGIIVKNCTFTGKCTDGVLVATALAVGQACTVNNCIFRGGNRGVKATTTAEFVSNYNTFSGVATSHTNVTAGANDVTYPPLFDTRWFFELVGGKGRMLSPFDLASYSQLVNLAGTSPTTTDMRGMAVIGAQREWGALEYDPALLFRRVIARQV